MDRFLSRRRIAALAVLTIAIVVMAWGHAKHDPFIMIWGLSAFVLLLISAVLLLLHRSGVLIHQVQTIPYRVEQKLQDATLSMRKAQELRDEEMSSVFAQMRKRVGRSFEEIEGALAKSVERDEAIASSLSALAQANQDVQQQLADVSQRFRAMSSALSSVVDAVTASMEHDAEVLDHLGVIRREVSVFASDTSVHNMLAKLPPLITQINPALEHLAHLAEEQRDTASGLNRQIQDLSGQIPTRISSQIAGQISTLDSRNDQRQITLLQEVEALHQLYQQRGFHGFFPLLGGWAMDPSGMLGTMRLAADLKPSLIVECGSGTSTLWLCELLERHGHGSVVSLEHEPIYADATRNALRESGLEHRADIRHTPLEDRRIGDESFQWYSASSSDFEKGAIDLLLVDGPPGKSGHLARYPALPLLVDALADGAHIVLDDAGRPDEQESTARWLAEFPGLRDLGLIGARSRLFRLSKNRDTAKQA